MHYAESYIRGNKFPVLCVCVRYANTWVGGVNPEALVPKATQEDEAVISRDDEALRADLDALVQQVGDLTPVIGHVTGCGGKKNRREIDRCTQEK